ncbi:MAG: M28 family peptidase [Chloroflexi bacterium]|nr:M28 family peptidase [Chloroflexota bacterium]
MPRTPRYLLLLALASALLLASACFAGGSGAALTSTIEPATATIVPTATAVPSPTPDPIGPATIDGQRAYEHVRKLAVEIGSRAAGTPGEIAARDYIRTTLERYGYDVTLQDFAFDASSYLPARVDAGGTAIPAYAFAGSGAGAARGRLVNAGIGRPEDFPAGGIGGGIALMQRAELSFTDKVANAIAAGASGAIIYNNEAGSMLGDLSAPVAVPVTGITQAAGEDLIARVAAGPVDATVTVSPPKGTAYNVIAKPKGVTQCATITGGHYDSVAVTGGADDNASGSAAVLESARMAAALRLPGANCFVLFSAEEFGLFGSKHYVEAMADGDLQALRAMVNLDVVGTKESLTLFGSADLIETARLEAQKLGATAVPATLPPGAGSDHLSFERAGVPVVMLYRADGLIHTPGDAIDRIEAGALQETVAVAIATLRALNGG